MIRPLEIIVKATNYTDQLAPALRNDHQASFSRLSNALIDFVTLDLAIRTLSPEQLPLSAAFMTTAFAMAYDRLNAAYKGCRELIQRCIEYSIRVSDGESLRYYRGQVSGFVI